MASSMLLSTKCLYTRPAVWCSTTVDYTHGPKIIKNATLLFLFFVMPPKDLAPFSYISPTKNPLFKTSVKLDAYSHIGMNMQQMHIGTLGYSHIHILAHWHIRMCEYANVRICIQLDGRLFNNKVCTYYRILVSERVKSQKTEKTGPPTNPDTDLLLRYNLSMGVNEMRVKISTLLCRLGLVLRLG